MSDPPASQPVPEGAGTSKDVPPGEPAATEPAEPPPPSQAEWRLGVRYREEGGRISAVHVLEGGVAHDAGLNAGDELVAVNGMRAAAAALAAVQGREPGSVLSLTVMRRNELRTVEVVLVEQAERRGRIVAVASLSAEQAAVRTGWLGAGGDL